MSAPKPSTQVNAAASKGIMRPVNRFLEQWIPSALTFAIVLTLIVAILAFVLTGASPLEVVTSWGVGLSGLLEFMTQMCLILLLGHILANTGPVQALLTRLAEDYDTTWVFAVDGLLGATPEMLVRLERGLVTSRVLAGTIRRRAGRAGRFGLVRRCFSRVRPAGPWRREREARGNIWFGFRRRCGLRLSIRFVDRRRRVGGCRRKLGSFECGRHLRRRRSRCGSRQRRWCGQCRWLKRCFAAFLGCLSALTRHRRRPPLVEGVGSRGELAGEVAGGLVRKVFHQ